MKHLKVYVSQIDKYWEPHNASKWDWSAYIFTKYFSTILKEKNKNFKLTSIDINKDAFIC